MPGNCRPSRAWGGAWLRGAVSLSPAVFSLLAIAHIPHAAAWISPASMVHSSHLVPRTCTNLGKERSPFRAAGSWGIGRMRAPSLRMCAAAEGQAGVETSETGAVHEGEVSESGAVREGEVHFINLSNGAESLPLLQGIPVAFCRIQSSHCESQNWNGILGGLDPTLLIHLAMGHTCYIHDYGSRNKKRKAPRAVWYGVTFIKFALHVLWELPGDPEPPVLRGHMVEADFRGALRNLDKAVKKKIRYFRDYARTSEVKLYGVVGATDIDGRRDLHVALCQEHSSKPGGLVQAPGTISAAALEKASLAIFDTSTGFTWDGPE
ncbi:hypothetical protein T484DRAFT_1935199 [Baffinella frigidus]|nr:hypothetical protein T484DRAFT_1935199 [Cryptophyta sp. CCMP2293]